ncbi:hypothetical protein SAMN04487912_12111 [Arthrobacter sp. cf158]|uniref:hypothetical protein n=1 Tax=Arthrobacter sp. cf158 TaxID=1761744 RepID=UPI00089C9B13|nr:hypothetical protein [Arthrobacter sp. cf158]SDX60154.1 hypothetical protein SAMN04487912_12111 [Arthrobacter sp. cf158]
MVKTNEKAQLVAATFVTAVSTFGAWHYSQPALSSVPSLSLPGAVFVGVKQGSASAPVRVDVDLRFSPSPSLTLFDMVLKGDASAAVPPDLAGELMVGFCGAMKDVHLRKTSNGEELTLEPPIPPTDSNPKVSSIGLEFSLDDDCVMTVISPTDFQDRTVGEAGISWAVSLEGETTAPTEAFTGSHHRYAFPRIATLTLPTVIDLLDIQAVAASSVVNIQPRDLPAEYVPTISSPQVEDITAPGWNLPLHSADTTAGFRLTGVDQQDETEAQRQLFLASAAAGTAGGGLIWLVGAIGPVLNDVIHKRRNRVAPVAEDSGGLALSPGSRADGPEPPDCLRHVAAPALLALAGATLTWMIRKRRR